MSQPAAISHVDDSDVAAYIHQLCQDPRLGNLTYEQRRVAVQRAIDRLIDAQNAGTDLGQTYALVCAAARQQETTPAAMIKSLPALERTHERSTPNPNRG